MLQTLLDNFLHNLFKPLLLFFYAGFLIPILRINFEFPKALYQSLTIFLLLAIGWHGGEELAKLPPAMIGQATGFMIIGFVTNLLTGFAAYFALRKFTSLRKIDAATVAGYYGSDSAGTFVTACGVLAASQIAFAAYMPVMLAVMEIPGCLVALILVSKLRREGMDAHGNMPEEPGFADALGGTTRRIAESAKMLVRPLRRTVHVDNPAEREEAMVGVAASVDSVNGDSNTYGGGNGSTTKNGKYGHGRSGGHAGYSEGVNGHHGHSTDSSSAAHGHSPEHAPKQAGLGKLLHEVFLNPGTFLLFAGLAIGFISRIQGEGVVIKYDDVFEKLFQGLLCLFLLEMGVTASRRIKDLHAAGWQFAAFAVIAPNVFATFGMLIAHAYSMWLGVPFAVGTYVLFAVLCGAASYIAMPAVQRMAIPEASPTLPLAASLGLTFSYNVTIGIPIYIMIATALTTGVPVGA
jgi:hypothetical protein